MEPWINEYKKISLRAVFKSKEDQVTFETSSFLIPMKAECLIYCNVNQRKAEIKIHGSIFCLFVASSFSFSFSFPFSFSFESDSFFIVAVVYLWKHSREKKNLPPFIFSLRCWLEHWARFGRGPSPRARAHNCNKSILGSGLPRSLNPISSRSFLVRNKE